MVDHSEGPEPQTDMPSPSTSDFLQGVIKQQLQLSSASQYLSLLLPFGFKQRKPAIAAMSICLGCAADTEDLST